MFFTLFGYWAQGGGRAPSGLVHNLLMQFFTYIGRQSKFLKLIFFAVVII